MPSVNIAFYDHYLLYSATFVITSIILTFLGLNYIVPNLIYHICKEIVRMVTTQFAPFLCCHTAKLYQSHVSQFLNELTILGDYVIT